MKALQAKISQELNEAQEGNELMVLVEGFADDGTAFGRCYRQADDVDDNIYIEGGCKAEIGDMVKVKVLQGFTEDLVAEEIN